MHRQIAIARRKRFAPDRRHPRKIIHRQRSAELRKMRDHPFAKLAAIEMIRAFRSDSAQRVREIGLAKNVAEFEALSLAQIVLRPAGIEVRPLLQDRALFVEFRDAELDQGKAVFGQRDGGRKDVRQGLAPIGSNEFAPTRKIAGRVDREHAALQLFAPAESIRRKCPRHARREVERAHALFRRDPHGREAEAGEAGHERLDHVERRRRRRRSVEGVAALRQKARAGLGGERMSSSDHAVKRCHRGPAAMHCSFPLFDRIRRRPQRAGYVDAASADNERPLRIPQGAPRAAQPATP